MAKISDVADRQEVRQLVVALILRRGELVAQAQVQGQLVADLEIVLHVAEVHALAEVRDRVVVQLVVIRRAPKMKSATL